MRYYEALSLEDFRRKVIDYYLKCFETKVNPGDLEWYYYRFNDADLYQGVSKIFYNRWIDPLLSRDLKVSFDHGCVSPYPINEGDPILLSNPSSVRNLPVGFQIDPVTKMPYLGVLGGINRIAVYFILYWDGRRIRGYVPTEGNLWNTSTKCGYSRYPSNEEIQNRWKRFGEVDSIEYRPEDIFKDIRGHLKLRETPSLNSCGEVILNPSTPYPTDGQVEDLTSIKAVQLLNDLWDHEYHGAGCNYVQHLMATVGDVRLGFWLNQDGSASMDFEMHSGDAYGADGSTTKECLERAIELFKGYPNSIDLYTSSDLNDETAEQVLAHLEQTYSALFRKDEASTSVSIFEELRKSLESSDTSTLTSLVEKLLDMSPPEVIRQVNLRNSQA